MLSNTDKGYCGFNSRDRSTRNNAGFIQKGTIMITSESKNTHELFSQIGAISLLGCSAYAKRPEAGDAVMMIGDRFGSSVRVGSTGIIDGMLRRFMTEGSIIFNNSTFRDDRYVSSSGGPGTIITDLSLLEFSGKTILQKFWRWKDGDARGDNAFHYYAYVPLWVWDGQDS
jgi:hypothetical protein